MAFAAGRREQPDDPEDLSAVPAYDEADISPAEWLGSPTPALRLTDDGLLVLANQTAEDTAEILFLDATGALRKSLRLGDFSGALACFAIRSEGTAYVLLSRYQMTEGSQTPKSVGHSLRVYGPSGGLLQEWGLGERAYDPEAPYYFGDMAVDSRGRVYLVGSAGSR